MAIFTAIANAVGLLIGASSTSFFVTATAWVLKTVAGIGINLLLQKKTKKPSFSIEGSLQAGETVPRSIIMGWRGVKGSLVYANTYDAPGGAPNEYLVWVIALSDWKCQALTGIWIDGVKCDIESTSHADFGKPVTQYSPGGNPHLWVKFYDGTQTEADPFLVSKVSSPEHPYESTRVGFGISYVIVTAKIEESLFSGFPDFLFEVLGAKLYDITKDSTQGGSGSHRWNDQSTWGGDGDYLLPVQAYAVLRGLYHGGRWFYGLQNLHQSRLPADDWIDAVNKARNPVDGPDGPLSEPEFRCSIELPVNVNINETLDTMCAAGLARISEFGGKYSMFIGEPPEPTFFFDDSTVISTSERIFTPFKPLEETITGATGKFPSPEDGWNSRDAPPMYRTDLEVAAGNRRLVTDVSLDLVPYPNQVQRVMRAAILEGQRDRRHTLGLPSEYWEYCVPGAIGEFTSNSNGYINKQFRVEGVQDLPNLDVIVDLVEIDPSDYDYDYDTDYRPIVPTNWGTKHPSLQGVPGWDIRPHIIYDNATKARRATAIAEFAGDQADVKSIRIQIRLVSSGSIDYDNVFDYGELVSGSKFITIPAGSLLPDEVYQGRAIFVPISGRKTNWSDWDGFVTDLVLFTGDDIADGAVSITKFADGLAPVELHEGPPSDSDPANFEGRTWFDADAGLLWTYSNGAWSHIEADVLDGSITSAKLADAAVTASKLMDSAVTALKLADAAVEANKIATGAVLSAKIADNAVTVSKIIDGAVAAAKIATGAVLSDKLADNAVTVSKINAGAVTEVKIADLAISASKLADEAVTNAKLGPLAVDASKIANNAITNTKIDDNAISTPKLQANAVVADKIAANAVVASKLYIGDFNNICPDADMQDNGAWGGTRTLVAASSDGANATVWTSSNIIRDDSGAGNYGFVQSRLFSVTADETLWVQAQIRRSGAGSGGCSVRIYFYDSEAKDNGVYQTIVSTSAFVPVTGSLNVPVPAGKKFGLIQAHKDNTTPASYIFGGVVVRRAASGELIVDGAITADKVAANAISAASIQSNAVTSDKIIANAITTAKINTGAITANEIASNAVTTAKINAGAVTANEIATNAVTAAKIVAGTITATELASNSVTTAKINAGAVTATEIATNAVTTAKINAGAVTATEIASNAVTAAKIAANSVTADKVAANAIYASNLIIADFNNIVPDNDMQDFNAWSKSNDLQLSSATIEGDADSWNSSNIAVLSGPDTSYAQLFSKWFPVNSGETLWCQAQLRFSGTLGPTTSSARVYIQWQNGAGTVTDGPYIIQGSSYTLLTNDIKAVVPASAKRARFVTAKTNAVGAQQQYKVGGFLCRRASSGELIVDGAVTADKIAANSITGNKIQANTITSGLIQAGAIGATEIASNAISSGKIQAGAIITSHLSTTNLQVSNAQIANGAITSAKVQSLDVGGLE